MKFLRTSSRTWRGFAFIAALAVVGNIGAIDITPTFDSSITGLSNADEIMTTIRAVCMEYKYRLAERTPVSIIFANMDTGLGQSSTAGDHLSYQAFRAALNARKTSNLDQLAVASLPNQPTNPVTGYTNVWLTSAHTRALGLGPGSSTDCTISVNLATVKPGRSSPYPTGGYSLFSVLCHEVDEAIGFLSALNNQDIQGAPGPEGSVDPADLFRYDQNNNRTWTTDLSTEAYMYVPGFGRIARFNQGVGGDRQDWYQTHDQFGNASQPVRVQDWQGTGLQDPRLSDAEMQALDVIGYTILPTPIWVDFDSGSDIFGNKSYFSPMGTLPGAEAAIDTGGTIIVDATGGPTVHRTRLTEPRPMRITAFNGILRFVP